ncbi:MAG TPA: acetate--CoA ligase family protein [Candidatus Eisenbacteria bacterium]|nr:acetate--CoA ligase family protein [Candidatus Eisenbacteria bacterium]
MPDFLDLKPLLEPESVAIVGASPKAGWAARIWGMLRQFDYPGKIYLVNPRYETLWQQRCYPGLDALPAPVDNAVFIVPAPAVVEMLQNSSGKTFRAATILSGGFGEGDDGEGSKRKAFLQAYAREHGTPMCGPNCMGLGAVRARAMLFPEQRLNEIPAGGLAIVSQSGGLLGGVLRSAVSRAIGLSYFASSGNEAVAELSDYIHHFLRDENTRVIAAFIEGVKDGNKFRAVAEEALAFRKPLIALKIGRSSQGVAAALAHTGSLAGDDRVFDAICSEYGISRVGDLDELLNGAELFLGARRLPGGRRAAFVTFSGGVRGLISDLAQIERLELPALADSTAKELSGLLGVGTSIGNPLDTGWSGLSSRETYLKCVNALLADARIDMLALQEELPLNNSRPDKEGNLVAVAELAQESKKPISMFSMVTQSLNDYAREFKTRCPLPFLQGADNAVKAQRHLASFAEAVRRRSGEGARAVKPLSARATQALRSKKVLNELEAYSVLSEYGLALAKFRLAVKRADAVAAAKEITGPVALKLVASGVTHKTELDGIRLNLTGSEAIEAAWIEMEEGFRRRTADTTPDGFLVQEMVDGVETIIGAHDDPQFGPVVMFGMGGQAVEIYQDVVFRLAPVTLEDAAGMIRSVKGFPLLSGFRGRPRVDLHALASAIVVVSELAVAGKDLIQSIDINPFVCLERGGKAVDAAIVTRASTRL